MFIHPKPEDIFTPRLATVNSKMYVERRMLEDALKASLRGNLHTIIHGDSGTGKSWLYKKVLGDLTAKYEVANLANAARLGSIEAELKNIVDRCGKSVKTGYEEEKTAGANAGVASGKLSHKALYEIGRMEPFEECLNMLRCATGSHPAVLVFDNLEAIFNTSLLDELANILILCDDERYANYKVHIIIVGVPADIKEYYYKTPHHHTIANRLREIPEVSRLSKNEAIQLLELGFIEQLGYSIENKKNIFDHILWITDRVPQMLHEYGLELSLRTEESNRIITEKLVENTDIGWGCQSLHHAYAVIESHMNERDTRAGRRNQTLFALGIADGEQFKPQEIEEYLRGAFPFSTIGTTLNIAQVLAQLASGARPIIKRSPKGDAYSFVDPHYRMILRIMLIKTDDERVSKLPISR